ncbi:Protein PYRICULARIA ORYZAE RESISTANCE 21 [Rhynchospora pubera]|uniref:Heavy metal transport/detoxification superfamily protein n=1 Tax=Rhynchospora pubera TaxID=906938 RepID=A0AAV8CNH0_9POAL|nr:Protein PYRICULARIA ORYZAE RESISTANCE 21 [Rhynchospora pubera]KAJ4756270.1 Heavy metal transport/detoxification superfamily protein [Rhynchospora pubera]KAJ4814544.1 Protein PYRICULARIA ORYZAE RESISTANCE 21 [Rhynchospora pubera]
MAEKTSTLILKVDLECYRCHKEIVRLLGKLQDKENIKTINYDEKNNTVTISGPFDPQRLSTKLSCRAGKVIKDIQIKENKEKEKEKPKKEEKPAEKPKEDKPAEKAPEKEKKPAETEKKPEKDAKPAEKKTEKDANPSKSGPEVEKKIEPVPAPQLPVCCPAPYYEGYYGGGRCCACGHVFGYAMAPPYGPQFAPPYDGYRVYHFFSEEDPSASTCTIM